MLESIFNKAAGLKVCNSIKKKLQYSCLAVKLAAFLKTLFFAEEFPWLLLTFNSFFYRSLGGGENRWTVSNKYQIQLKKVFAPAKIQKQPT